MMDRTEAAANSQEQAALMNPKLQNIPPWRLSVAPMMEWTDRHCRFMHRLLSRRALLYTEMVAAAAIVRGPKERLLAFSPEEHPVALQLGGSDPAELAEAVRIAAAWGYDEINLNVGCPSDRVQNGAFGACLMRDPALVARCCAAMIAASEAAGGPEITVKCRIGVDDDDPAVRLPQFLDIVSSAGVSRFAVHARKAWLKGLSPKENRSIPPLDYDLVRAMKRRTPALDLSLNGGLESLAQAEAERVAGEGLALDGVMIGRAAYHDPVAILGAADRVIYGEDGPDADPFAVAEAMVEYTAARMAEGVRMNSVARHMLGLFAGRPGARAWRRALSDGAPRVETGAEARALFAEALAPLSRAAA